MRIRQRCAAAVRSLGAWWNAALLAAFPFADEIVQALSDHLPSLAPYLPANVYKWGGVALVLLNVAGAVRTRLRKREGEA